MIVLDTAALLVIRRPVLSSEVTSWLAGQPSSALFTTTITRGELIYGLHLLPDGQRRADFPIAAHHSFDEDLAGQVLGVDSAAADAFA